MIYFFEVRETYGLRGYRFIEANTGVKPGVIDAVNVVDGPPSAHQYKATSDDGSIVIDSWATPSNANERPADVKVTAASASDLCLMWLDAGGTARLVVWEKIRFEEEC